jgi:ribulose bisphosphate carboxylase small subunit
MKAITITRLENAEQKTYTFKSMNEATKTFGAKSGMNTENAVKFLLSQGFKIENVEQGATRKASLIENLIKQVSVIDKTRISELENELKELVLNFDVSNTADIENIKRVKDELANAKTPKHDLKSILAYIENAYNEYTKSEPVSE